MAESFKMHNPHRQNEKQPLHGQPSSNHGSPNGRGMSGLNQGHEHELPSYDPSNEMHGQNQSHSDYYLDQQVRGHSHQGHDSPGPQHAQSQIELLRSIQASTQRLYDVFDYNIGMIEELEKHETHGKRVPNSGILSHAIPVDHRKPQQEVFAGIELQLKCLQAQMKSLPPEVTSKAKKGLVEQTIKWAASREAEGIPCGDVDHYCKNVLEILLFDAPKELPRVDRAPKIKLTTEQVNEAIYQMAAQRHLGEKQDEEFHRDPRKKAKLRKKRQSEDIREGVRRLANLNPELATALDEYIPDASMDTT